MATAGAIAIRRILQCLAAEERCTAAAPYFPSWCARHNVFAGKRPLCASFFHEVRPDDARIAEEPVRGVDWQEFRTRHRSGEAFGPWLRRPRSAVCTAASTRRPTRFRPARACEPGTWDREVRRRNSPFRFGETAAFAAVFLCSGAPLAQMSPFDTGGLRVTRFLRDAANRRIGPFPLMHRDRSDQ
jgi:hypothetical protein